MIDNGEFQNMLSDTLDYLYDWEREARVDFEFASLKQWEDEDERMMKSQGRPALVFDRTRPIIASVAGAEITQRYEPKFLPRDADLDDVDVTYSEAGNKVYRWIRDRGDFAHHESAAFQSALICGVGATELYVDFDEDPDGTIMMQRVPIWELGWDPASIAPNYSDGRYVIRDRWLDESEIIQRFGREAAEQAKLLGKADKPGAFRGFVAGLIAREVDDPRQTYFENRSGKYYDPKRKRIRVWELVRKEKTYKTRIIPPSFIAGDEVLVTPSKAGELIQLYQAQIMQHNQRVIETGGIGQMGEPLMAEPPLEYIEDFPSTKIIRSYHAGSETLAERELPMHYFPYQFITAFEDWSDPSRRYHFGLMRSMRDPQKYANKFFSHAVHMWASNPKGGIIFEEDLFRDNSEAKTEWASATGFLPVEVGKLQTPKPKYEIIPNGVNFNGIQMLLQHAVSSIGAAAGVSEQYSVGNPTDLRRTAASAVQSVKESNQVTISQPFDALRMYKRVQGRLILDYVAAYVPDRQLQRLLSPQEYAEFGEAAKSGKLHQQYEVIAEEAPASKSKQMEVFNKIMETSFIPQLMEIGVTVPPELAKFFPFPPDINAEFQRVLQQTKDMMDAQSQIQILQLEAQKAMLMQQLQQAGLVAETEENQMVTENMEMELAQQQMGAQAVMQQMDPMGMMQQQMMAEAAPPPEEEGPPPEG